MAAGRGRPDGSRQADAADLLHQHRIRLVGRAPGLRRTLGCRRALPPAGALQRRGRGAQRGRGSGQGDDVHPHRQPDPGLLRGPPGNHHHPGQDAQRGRLPGDPGIRFARCLRRPHPAGPRGHRHVPLAHRRGRGTGLGGGPARRQGRQRHRRDAACRHRAPAAGRQGRAGPAQRHLVLLRPGRAGALRRPEPPGNRPDHRRDEHRGADGLRGRVHRRTAPGARPARADRGRRTHPRAAGRIHPDRRKRLDRPGAPAAAGRLLAALRPAGLRRHQGHPGLRRRESSTTRSTRPPTTR